MAASDYKLSLLLLQIVMLTYVGHVGTRSISSGNVRYQKAPLHLAQPYPLTGSSTMQQRYSYSPVGQGYHPPIEPAGTFYDRKRGILRSFPGGGIPLLVDYQKRCSNNYVGIKPHPKQSQYYYVCKPDCVVFGKCQNLQAFDAAKGQCSTYPQPDYTPICTKPGRFPILTDCTIYYRCDSRLRPQIFSCPRNTVFSPPNGKCISDAKCSPTIVTSYGTHIPEDCIHKFPPCVQGGIYRTPSDCSLYYTCAQQTNGIYLQTRYKCPELTFFDTTRGVCRPQHEVACDAIQLSELVYPRPTTAAHLPVVYPPHYSLDSLENGDYPTEFSMSSSKEDEPSASIGSNEDSYSTEFKDHGGLSHQGRPTINTLPYSSRLERKSTSLRAPKKSDSPSAASHPPTTTSPAPALYTHSSEGPSYTTYKPTRSPLQYDSINEISLRNSDLQKDILSPHVTVNTIENTLDETDIRKRSNVLQNKTEPEATRKRGILHSEDFKNLIDSDKFDMIPITTTTPQGFDSLPVTVPEWETTRDDAISTTNNEPIHTTTTNAQAISPKATQPLVEAKNEAPLKNFVIDFDDHEYVYPDSSQNSESSMDVSYYEDDSEEAVEKFVTPTQQPVPRAVSEVPTTNPPEFRDFSFHVGSAKVKDSHAHSGINEWPLSNTGTHMESNAVHRPGNRPTIGPIPTGFVKEKLHETHGNRTPLKRDFVEEKLHETHGNLTPLTPRPTSFVEEKLHDRHGSLAPLESIHTDLVEEKLHETHGSLTPLKPIPTGFVEEKFHQPHGSRTPLRSIPTDIVEEKLHETHANLTPLKPIPTDFVEEKLHETHGNVTPLKPMFTDFEEEKLHETHETHGNLTPLKPISTDFVEEKFHETHKNFEPLKPTPADFMEENLHETHRSLTPLEPISTGFVEKNLHETHRNLEPLKPKLPVELVEGEIALKEKSVSHGNENANLSAENVLESKEALNMETTTEDTVARRLGFVTTNVPPIAVTEPKNTESSTNTLDEEVSSAFKRSPIAESALKTLNEPSNMAQASFGTSAEESSAFKRSPIVESALRTPDEPSNTAQRPNFESFPAVFENSTKEIIGDPNNTSFVPPISQDEIETDWTENEINDPSIGIENTHPWNTHPNMVSVDFMPIEDLRIFENEIAGLHHEFLNTPTAIDFDTNTESHEASMEVRQTKPNLEDLSFSPNGHLEHTFNADITTMGFLPSPSAVSEPTTFRLTTNAMNSIDDNFDTANEIQHSSEVETATVNTTLDSITAKTEVESVTKPASSTTDQLKIDATTIEVATQESMIDSTQSSKSQIDISSPMGFLKPPLLTTEPISVVNTLEENVLQTTSHNEHENPLLAETHDLEEEIVKLTPSTSPHTISVETTQTSTENLKSVINGVTHTTSLAPETISVSVGIDKPTEETHLGATRNPETTTEVNESNNGIKRNADIENVLEGEDLITKFPDIGHPLTVSPLEVTTEPLKAPSEATPPIELLTSTEKHLVSTSTETSFGTLIVNEEPRTTEKTLLVSEELTTSAEILDNLLEATTPALPQLTTHLEVSDINPDGISPTIAPTKATLEAINEETKIPHETEEGEIVPREVLPEVNTIQSSTETVVMEMEIASTSAALEANTIPSSTEDPQLTNEIAIAATQVPFSSTTEVSKPASTNEVIQTTTVNFIETENTRKKKSEESHSKSAETVAVKPEMESANEISDAKEPNLQALTENTKTQLNTIDESTVKALAEQSTTPQPISVTTEKISADSSTETLTVESTTSEPSTAEKTTMTALVDKSSTTVQPLEESPTTAAESTTKVIPIEASTKTTDSLENIFANVDSDLAAKNEITEPPVRVVKSANAIDIDHTINVAATTNEKTTETTRETSALDLQASTSMPLLNAVTEKENVLAELPDNAISPTLKLIGESEKTSEPPTQTELTTTTEMISVSTITETTSTVIVTEQAPQSTADTFTESKQISKREDGLNNFTDRPIETAAQKEIPADVLEQGTGLIRISDTPPKPISLQTTALTFTQAITTPRDITKDEAVGVETATTETTQVDILINDNSVDITSDDVRLIRNAQNTFENPEAIKHIFRQNPVPNMNSSQTVTEFPMNATDIPKMEVVVFGDLDLSVLFCGNECTQEHEHKYGKNALGDKHAVGVQWDPVSSNKTMSLVTA